MNNRNVNDTSACLRMSISDYRLTQNKHHRTNGLMMPIPHGTPSPIPASLVGFGHARGTTYFMPNSSFTGSSHSVSAQTTPLSEFDIKSGCARSRHFCGRGWGEVTEVLTIKKWAHSQVHAYALQETDRKGVTG
jgi:hypothetical protein